MLDDTQKDGLRQWFGQDDVLGETRRLLETKDWEALEEYLQMRSMFPLSVHANLPAYLKTDDDKPLIPSNCNPRDDVEGWQDAVEVAWEVFAAETGSSRDDVHLSIKSWQEKSWESFLQSVDEREKKQGQ